MSIESINGKVEIAGHHTIMQFNFRHFKIFQLEKLALFMPPDRMIGGILFFPVCPSVFLFVCLFVCLLSTLTFAITFEP